MEEKERYEWRYSPKTMEDHMFDNLTKIKIYYENIPNLLNQYEKQIKELEETNRVLSNELTKNNILKQDHIETCCGTLIFEIPKIKAENQQLKQQLAEKEKVISNLNGLVRERDKQIKNLKTNKKRVIEHKNKAKINFAIEQLEKVKDTINKLPITDMTDYGGFKKIYQADATRIIDQQIKELKGKVETILTHKHEHKGE